MVVEMNILVTGGAGFIGSNFIYFILEKYAEYNIICVDKLTYAGNLSTLDKAFSKNRFKFYKADISNRVEMFKIFKENEIDVIVNFAAESHVDRSILNPGIFLETNVLGTQVLLDAVNKFSIKRFHQVSTDEVYGDLPIDRPDLLFSEHTPLNTSSPYSASKASADLLVLAYYRTYNTPVTISRCSNNYGPFHFPEKLIPLMIERALKNDDLPVYGTGENIRDWLHVTDHCSAIDLIIHKGKIGDVYNVGGNNERSNLQVVKLILDELKKPYSLIKYVEDRKGHDLRYGINALKIKRELGWHPTYNFESGLKDTVQWYLDNQKWVNSIISGEYLTYMEENYGKK
jgi:dTDP-glucose 4,6-dehydratase